MEKQKKTKDLPSDSTKYKMANILLDGKTRDVIFNPLSVDDTHDTMLIVMDDGHAPYGEHTQSQYGGSNRQIIAAVRQNIHPDVSHLFVYAIIKDLDYRIFDKTQDQDYINNLGHALSMMEQYLQSVHAACNVSETIQSASFRGTLLQHELPLSCTWSEILKRTEPFDKFKMDVKNLESVKLECWIGKDCVWATTIDKAQVYELGSSFTMYQKLWDTPKGYQKWPKVLKDEAPIMYRQTVDRLVASRATLVDELVIVSTHLKALKQYH